MDQNQQRLQSSFLSGAFASGFPGLTTGTSSDVALMTLQQLSNLSAPMLSSATLPTNLWAAAQQQQEWIDQVQQQAKVAAMLPVYEMYVAKGLEQLSGANILTAKAAAAAVSAQTAAAVTSTSAAASIFPSQTISLASLPTTIRTELNNVSCVNSPAGPSSANPSSNRSVSTPHEIDVGGLSQPGSQSQPYDLSLRESTDSTPQPSTSTTEDTIPPLIVKPIAAVASPIIVPSTSKEADVPTTPTATATKATTITQNGTKSSGGDTNPLVNSTGEDNWTDNIDVADIFKLSSVFQPQVPATSTAQVTYPAPVPSQLDEADNDIDRLLNVLERGEQTKQPAAFPFPFQNLLPGATEDNPSLSPVQFTPPDSPSGGAQEALAELFAPEAAPAPKRHVGGPSTSKNSVQKAEPKLFVKKDPVYKKADSTMFRAKSAKMPVYKQHRGIIHVEQPEEDPAKDDAYSFTDEDDDLAALAEPKENKLPDELQQKIARIVTQGDLGRKNVYVPGIGFAVPKEEQPPSDLWRHVVPKKRFGAMGDGPRAAIPSTTLLPPAAQIEATAAAAALSQPDIVTLAESIRRRKKNRLLQQQYCKAEADKSTDCAKEEGVIMIHDGRVTGPGEHPPVPKLLIRIPRHVLEENNENDKEERKRRKRKKKNKDTEWEGSDKAKKKKSKKHKRNRRNSDQYESRFVNQSEEEDYDNDSPAYVKPEPIPPPPEEPPSDPSMFSKKRRLMMQWQDAENEKTAQAQAAAAAAAASVSEPVANGTRHKERARQQPRAIRSDFNTDLVKKRLSRFGPADGQLPKGTFVVCKADLFKDDCALWRVDNQNLLQKYPPRVDPETKKISYRNSSTYSGWCDQIASGYLTVKIRYLKQTRSEAVIEPEVPLADLFPAMSTELADTSDNCAVPEVPKPTKTPDEPAENEITFYLRDPSRFTLYNYVRAMLHHVLTLDFFQEIKESNDWNHLRVLTDIEKNNVDCLEKMRQRTKWPEKFEETITKYIHCLISDSEFGCATCQSCGARPIEKTIQLFGMELYDKTTLQPIEEVVQVGCESPLPATELLACSTCANISLMFHQIQHMRYHLLKHCENKLESIGSDHPDVPPEKIVEIAKESASWITKIIREYADVWKKVQCNDF